MLALAEFFAAHVRKSVGIDANTVWTVLHMNRLQKLTLIGKHLQTVVGIVTNDNRFALCISPTLRRRG